MELVIEMVIVLRSVSKNSASTQLSRYNKIDEEFMRIRRQFSRNVLLFRSGIENDGRLKMTIVEGIPIQW